MRSFESKVAIVPAPFSTRHVTKRTFGEIYERERNLFRRVRSPKTRKSLAACVKHVLDNDVSGIIIGFAVASMRDQFRATLIVDGRRTRGHYLLPRI